MRKINETTLAYRSPSGAVISALTLQEIGVNPSSSGKPLVLFDRNRPL